MTYCTEFGDGKLILSPVGRAMNERFSKNLEGLRSLAAATAGELATKDTVTTNPTETTGE